MIFNLFDLTLSQVPILQTAVYSVVEPGLTTTVDPSELSDQTIVPLHVPTAVKVILCPAHINVESEEIIGAAG